MDNHSNIISATISMDLADVFEREHSALVFLALSQAIDKLIEKEVCNFEILYKDSDFISGLAIVLYEDYKYYFATEIHINSIMFFYVMLFYDILYFKYKENNRMNQSKAQELSLRAHKAWETRNANKAAAEKAAKEKALSDIYKARAAKAAATRKANKEASITATLSPQQRAWITRRAKTAAQA